MSDHGGMKDRGVSEETVNREQRAPTPAKNDDRAHRDEGEYSSEHHVHRVSRPPSVLTKRLVAEHPLVPIHVRVTNPERRELLRGEPHVHQRLTEDRSEGTPIPIS